MAKTRNILKRVRAVGNIRTVTRAMQMVATARFKVVHDRLASFSPFSTNLLQMVADLVLRASAGEKLSHPLLVPQTGIRRDVLLVLTSNRGLCGSYNSSVLKLAMNRLEQLRGANYEVVLHVVGGRGARYLRFRKIRVDHEYMEFSDMPQYPEVAALGDAMMTQFLGGKISGLEVAYTQFISGGQQKPVITKILPMEDLPQSSQAGVDPSLMSPCDFLPSPERILRRLLPNTVRLKLYQCFLDAAAAEQLMRRVAMQAATDNADEMTHDLRIMANRMRQMQITTELAEIIGGRAGLEGR
jgi:F-type H+-transporting ATPase subunit gamma